MAKKIALINDDDIQENAMTINLTPRKCLKFRSPIEAFLADLGNDIEIRFR
jgi:IS30 family transposase